MGGALSGINNFGSIDGLNGPEGFNEVNHNGNQYGLMNEESTEKWLKEFKVEWERNFQNTCTEAKNECRQKKMQ